MKKKITLRSITTMLMVAAILWLFVGPEVLEARRSFGGSRGFGGGFSRSRSFGGSRLSTKSSTSGRSSFGGKTMSTGKSYVSRYGTPRRTITGGGASGYPSNYRVMDYGGYGSGLMQGYLMGHTSWMWMMPFHPAFYYSRPYYSSNPDGTVSVYPPTFSFGKLLFTLIIVGGIVYVVYRVIKNRRSGNNYSDNEARSSFD
jgi:hypothetical protein